jgi:hypothetical protein
MVTHLWESPARSMNTACVITEEAFVPATPGRGSRGRDSGFARSRTLNGVIVRNSQRLEGGGPTVQQH